MKSHNLVDAKNRSEDQDMDFQKKWHTYQASPFSNPSLYTIWKRFLRTTPGSLNAGDYQEIPTKLWEDGFQIPPLESAAHDKASFSREMDTRQEIEYENKLHDSSESKPHTLSMEELRDELSIWTPRNLTIFFVEYLIDSEIRIQNNADKSSAIEQKQLDERIAKIIGVYEQILKTLIAAEYYASEPVIYDPIFNSHPKLYDVASESARFAKIVNLLGLLLTAKHFELLKLHMSVNFDGLVLPNLDEFIRIGNMNNEQCETEIKALQEKSSQSKETEINTTGSLRRSQRVLSGLSDHDHSTDTPVAASSPAGSTPPPSPPISANNTPAAIQTTPVNQQVRSRNRPDVKQILKAIGITLAIAALAAIVVTAVIFSGGTVGLALAVATASTLGSLAAIGGMMTAADRAAHRRTERQHAQAEQRHRARSRNAELHSQVGYTQLPTSEEQADAVLPAATPTVTTSQPPSASPDAQNPEKRAASTLSGNRR